MMRTTRMSSAIVMSILRRLAALARSSSEPVRESGLRSSAIVSVFVSLVTPSTSSATSVPNFDSSSW